MGTILLIPVYVLLFLLTLLVILLILRWHLAFTGKVVLTEKQKTLNGQFRAGGSRRGFRLTLNPPLQIGIGPYENPWVSFRLPKSKTPRPKPEKPRKKKPGKTLTKRVNQVPLMKNLAGSLLRQIRWDGCEFTGSIGFPNPMTTGMLFACLYSLRSLVNSRHLQLAFQPVYTSSLNTEITGNLSISFQPGALALSAGWAYLQFKHLRKDSL